MHGEEHHERSSPPGGSLETPLPVAEEQRCEEEEEVEENVDNASGFKSASVSGSEAAPAVDKRESAAYLKKLLSTAKRKIESQKAELEELRASLAKKKQKETDWIDGNPANIRLKVKDVMDGNKFWCLVDFGLDKLQWMREEEFMERYGQYEDLSFREPDVSLSIFESDELRKQVEAMKESLAQTEEKFRKYKIKSELAKNQKDAEIVRLSENNLKYKQHNITDHDYHSQLEASRKEIERLEGIRGKMQKDVHLLKSQNDEFKAEIRKLNARMVSASHSPNSATPNGETEKELNDLKEKHENLRKEYLEFREKALRIIEEIENKSQEMQQKRHHPSSSDMSETEKEYVKNIFVKYLMTPESHERNLIETALMTALKLTPEEMKRIQSKRATLPTPTPTPKSVADFFSAFMGG